ncbi:MAG TPA: hypothetical protein PK695_03220 [Chitinophagaceae bacterium]|nr:hypothetical protein [Chitinophagaceae bacterium]HMX77270.1 hypothetical protein [Chitinophagaceae bacterium]HNA96484.1 hypothetical protein [Chitinophagaceae bacterium]HND96092.1 hypothetical protein [Chitinophagaceae bacterium]HNF45776.1 hypothetical protein [Chitinophagaceae bacterium]
MSLIVTLLGFFIIKFVLQFPFYYKNWKRSALLALLTSLTVAPLITMLYHETEADFLFVYIAMILFDAVVLYFLLLPNIWKAALASFIANTIVIVYFYLGNG